MTLYVMVTNNVHVHTCTCTQIMDFHMAELLHVIIETSLSRELETFQLKACHNKPLPCESPIVLLCYLRH